MVNIVLNRFCLQKLFCAMRFCQVKLVLSKSEPFHGWSPEWIGNDLLVKNYMESESLSILVARGLKSWLENKSNEQEQRQSYRPGGRDWSRVDQCYTKVFNSTPFLQCVFFSTSIVGGFSPLHNSGCVWLLHHQCLCQSNLPVSIQKSSR